MSFSAGMGSCFNRSRYRILIITCMRVLFCSDARAMVSWGADLTEDDFHSIETAIRTKSVLTFTLGYDRIKGVGFKKGKTRNSLVLKAHKLLWDMMRYARYYNSPICLREKLKKIKKVVGIYMRICMFDFDVFHSNVILLPLFMRGWNLIFIKMNLIRDTANLVCGLSA